MSKNRLTNLIDSSSPKEEKYTRHYIGASTIGSTCSRAIWYGSRGYKRLQRSNKQLRTLEIGRVLESMVVDCLLDSGLSIEIPNKDNGFLNVRDSRFENFEGHIDALWHKEDGTTAVIEIKTAKDASFRVFEQKGLQKWYPVYYAQVQSYMGMSGIHQAYLIAINKDTSEFHDEEVLFREDYYASICEKVAAINSMVEEPPAKISHDPLFFACKFCDFRMVCHYPKDKRP